VLEFHHLPARIAFARAGDQLLALNSSNFESVHTAVFQFYGDEIANLDAGEGLECSSRVDGAHGCAAGRGDRDGEQDERWPHVSFGQLLALEQR
jgi:hypothetical protein